MTVRILQGDCREVLRTLEAGSVECIVTDPPYGETSLEWDRLCFGWQSEALRVLAPHGSMWVFGSLRSFLATAGHYAGFAIAQDLIWEKHNGSNAFADRFRRVHEIAAQFYPETSKWADIYKQPLYTHDATARTVRRKQRPPQWGHIDGASYRSEDGGPRLMRSVMFFKSEHGTAEHPTQKPIATMLPLIEYSCPAGGTVLDPFAGSGTTGVAAQSIGRNAILIDINPDYCAMAERRVRNDAPLFAAERAPHSAPITDDQTNTRSPLVNQT